MFQIANQVIRNNPYVEIFRNFEENLPIDQNLKNDIKKGLLCKASDKQINDGRQYRIFFTEWEGDQKDYYRIFQNSSDVFHPFKNTFFYVVNLIVLVEKLEDVKSGEYTTFSKEKYQIIKPLDVELQENDFERINVNRNNYRFLVSLKDEIVQFEYIGTINDIPVFQRL